MRFRRPYYLNTINYKLRSKNFFLGRREDKQANKYTITLKCRYPGKYISAEYNLSETSINEVNFEKDIVASQLSKFLIISEDL